MLADYCKIAPRHSSVGSSVSWQATGQKVRLCPSGISRQLAIVDGHRLLCVERRLHFRPHRLDGVIAILNHVLAADFADQEAAKSVLRIISDVYFDSLKIRHVLHQGNKPVVLWRKSPRQSIVAARNRARLRRRLETRWLQRISREHAINVQLAFGGLIV